MVTDKDITWIDRGLEPKVKPNPDYPDGRDIDVTINAMVDKSCKVDLPYPAKRIGMYIVHCRTCGSNTGVTTAGRPDDPRSVRIPCKETLQ